MLINIDDGIIDIAGPKDANGKCALVHMGIDGSPYF
jgi:hypothetical protein